MKITKAQLKQLIKEELQVVLTNEEAGEMFGLEVQKELEEIEKINEDEKQADRVARWVGELRKAKGFKSALGDDVTFEDRSAANAAYAKWKESASRQGVTLNMTARNTITVS